MAKNANGSKSKHLSKSYIKAACAILQTKFTSAEIEEILKHAEANYQGLAPELPEEKTFGARMGLQLACSAVAFYYTLTERETDEEKAIQLLADTNWEIVKRSMAPIGWIGKLLFREPLQRVRWSFKIQRRLIYNSPGWFMDVVPVENGFGIDIFRCPLADYLRPLGLSKLCDGAFCESDFRTAELGGVRLARTETLSRGNDRCDFRYFPLNHEEEGIPKKEAGMEK